MICLHSDRPGEAIDPLQKYLDDPARRRRRRKRDELLDAARRLIAQWN